MRLLVSFSIMAGMLLNIPAHENASKNAVAIEALSRLKGIDLEANPAVKKAVVKTLDSVRGTPEYVQLIKDFNLKEQEAGLLETALLNATNSVGVDAIRLLAAQANNELLGTALKGSNGAALALIMGNAAEKQFVPLLVESVQSAGQPNQTRVAATKALSQTEPGARALLDLAKGTNIPADLKTIALHELQTVRWEEIKKEAIQLSPQTAQVSEAEFPPIAELVKRKGNPGNGAAVFRKQEVGCINCHQVNGEGIDFGPKLSEIGTKLGKDALYDSIINPSAGVAFGYEAWQLELKNGDEAFGLITSETAEEVTLKTQNGIATAYKKRDIAKRDKMSTSIMPGGLHLVMPEQDLVDLVEYLASLKKPGS
ncbi:MAG: c-type cytochrome [Verrucomicrobiota bacterium]|nr:c-type cytochrome [Verrucomicrobiota bacterium]